MGKNRVLESWSTLIANTIVHKILVGKTSKPESAGHLEAEEIEYRSQAIRKSKVYNWNDEDIKLLKEEIENKIRNKFKHKYADVEISKEEIQKFMDEEVKQMIEIEKN